MNVVRVAGVDIQYDATLRHNAYYVYYLMWRDEVVYVGQSSRVLGRMNAHSTGKKRKPFDRVLYRLCSTEQEMYDLEKREIARLQPELNIRDNPRYQLRKPDACIECGASSRFSGVLLMGSEGEPVWLCCNSERDCLWDYQKKHTPPRKGETP